MSSASSFGVINIWTDFSFLVYELKSELCFFGIITSHEERGSRQTSIGKHCEHQELRYCAMHFFLHNFTSDQHNSFFLSRFHLMEKKNNYFLFKENIYSSQESNESSKRGRKEEEEFSKSCSAALAICTATGAILRWKLTWWYIDDDKDHDYANYDHITSAMVATSRQIRQRIKKIWRKVFASFIYAKCIYIGWISFLLTWMNTLMILVIFVKWICIMLHLSHSHGQPAQ